MSALIIASLTAICMILSVTLTFVVSLFTKPLPKEVIDSAFLDKEQPAI